MGENIRSKLNPLPISQCGPHDVACSSIAKMKSHLQTTILNLTTADKEYCILYIIFLEPTKIIYISGIYRSLASLYLTSS